MPRLDVDSHKFRPKIKTLNILYKFDARKAAASRDKYLKKFDEIFANKK